MVNLNPQKTENIEESRAVLLDLINQVNSKSFLEPVRTYRGGLLEQYLKSVNAEKLGFLQKQVLIGCLLGDGSLKKDTGKNFFFKYDQNETKSDLVYLVYLIFQDIVGTPPKYVERKKRTRALLGPTDSLDPENPATRSIEFRTYRLSAFKFYHDHFYDINVKSDLIRTIPVLLSRWLTDISLALWFMSDGSKDKSGYLLHTQRLNLHDNKLLQQILGKKFGLEVSIHTDRQKDKTFYRLYISRNSVKQFNHLVTPYILPSCKYKLHELPERPEDVSPNILPDS